MTKFIIVSSYLKCNNKLTVKSGLVKDLRLLFYIYHVRFSLRYFLDVFMFVMSAGYQQKIIRNGLVLIGERQNKSNFVKMFFKRVRMEYFSSFEKEIFLILILYINSSLSTAFFPKADNSNLYGFIT